MGDFHGEGGRAAQPEEVAGGGLLSCRGPQTKGSEAEETLHGDATFSLDIRPARPLKGWEMAAFKGSVWHPGREW